MLDHPVFGGIQKKAVNASATLLPACSRIRHSEFRVGWVCTNSSCVHQGLVCELCIDEATHSDHQIVPLAAFLQSAARSGLTESMSSINNEIDELSAVRSELLKYFENFSQTLTSLVQSIEEKLFLAIDSDRARLARLKEVDEMYDRNVEEMMQQNGYVTQERIVKLLARRRKRTPATAKNAFSLMNSSEEHSKEIALIQRKAKSLATNIMSETPKFTGDIFAYFKQIEEALESFAKKQSNTNKKIKSPKPKSKGSDALRSNSQFSEPQFETRSTSGSFASPQSIEAAEKKRLGQTKDVGVNSSQSIFNAISIEDFQENSRSISQPIQPINQRAFDGSSTRNEQQRLINERQHQLFNINTSQSRAELRSPRINKRPIFANSLLELRSLRRSSSNSADSSLRRYQPITPMQSKRSEIDGAQQRQFLEFQQQPFQLSPLNGTSNFQTQQIPLQDPRQTSQQFDQQNKLLSNRFSPLNSSFSGGQLFQQVSSNYNSVEGLSTIQQQSIQMDSFSETAFETRGSSKLRDITLNPSTPLAQTNQSSREQHTKKDSLKVTAKLQPQAPTLGSQLQVGQRVISHDAKITSLQLLDGNFIVTGSSDWLVKVWERQNKQLVQCLECHTSGVSVVKCLDSSRMIASGDDSGLICVWNLSVQQLGKAIELRGHWQQIISICFQNEKTLISSSTDNNLIIWNIEEASMLKKVDTSRGFRDMVVYNKMVMAVSGKFVEFWDTTTYRQLKKVEAHDEEVNQISMISRKRQSFIVTCSDDACIYVWDGENKYEEVDCVSEKARDWTIAAFAYNEFYDAIVYVCNDRQRNNLDKKSKVMMYSLNSKQQPLLLKQTNMHATQISSVSQDVYVAFGEGSQLNCFKINQERSVSPQK